LEADGGRTRFRAFISYSHRDARFGRLLHRRLEGYRLPRRLVGRPARLGPAPARLAPVFRDREELAASGDLSAEVRAALERSDSLIVVCSPAASASQWVSREVETFRALHPDRPVLAAIIEGEPADCFPEALRRPAAEGAPVEPLAADFRPGRDGPQLGLLKLVAGVVGIGLDELVQRDAQRRLRRVTAVTAGAVTGMLAMGLLTIVALSARSEAERQRTQAEGLQEFMLTDLRDKLKGVGRLDILTAVNERALRYYEGQDLARLPVEALERRARILHAMGEDDETRGNHDAALAKFREARRTTSALLEKAPNDPERIFDESQSEFWLGEVDYARGRYAAAKPAFESYKQMTDKLVAIAPSNPKYQREAGYAEGNLCSVLLKEHTAPALALQSCKAALDHMQVAAGAHPDAEMQDDLINRRAWLADAFDQNGQPARALAERTAEEQMLEKRIAGDPKNMDLKDSWVALQLGLALLERQQGREDLAHARLERARATVASLAAYDPANARWKNESNLIEENLSRNRK
jgi:hypothetical protein